MLRPRIIPTLLVHKNGLTKTRRFKEHKYVGDPLNAVKIFNEKLVDEIAVFDIDASVEGRGPDFNLIAKLARECRMPLCYGGGVDTAEDVSRIVKLGVEKVAISSAALANPDLISEAAGKVGRQSIVIVLDVKKRKLGSGLDIYTHNGSRKTGVDLDSFLLTAQKKGAGEIVVNFIDRDGELTGYDVDAISRLYPKVSVPLTVLGGASCYENIAALIDRFGVIGAAAGSLFVFNGKYRAVLISYPNPEEKRSILAMMSKT